MKKEHLFVSYDIAFCLALAASILSLCGLQQAGTICRCTALVLFVVSRLYYQKQFGGSKAIAIIHVIGWIIVITDLELRYRGFRSVVNGLLLVCGAGLLLYSRYKESKNDKINRPIWSKVILFALAFVVALWPTVKMISELFPNEPNLQGPSPFDHIYRVEKVIEPMEGYSDSQAPLIHLFFNKKLYLIWDNSTYEYEDIGTFEYIRQDSEQGIVTENEKWGIKENNECSYLLTLEKDGSLTLSHAVRGKIEWCFLLSRVDTLICTVTSSAAYAGLTTDWFREGTFHGGTENLSFGEIKGKGKLILSFRGKNPATLQITEEYHSDGAVETREYTLAPDKTAQFVLSLETRGQAEGQYAIYRVPYETGEYVFGVRFFP